jgi:outer membrane protein assembly factor BamB
MNGCLPFRGIFLVSLLVFAGGPRTGLSAEPRWATLGGSFQRVGCSPYQGPTTGGIQWKFETGGAVVGSVTVGSDGRIHVPCEDGKLYTLSLEGKPLWVLDVNCPLLSAPTIGPDGRLYVGGRNGKLFAVAPDGHVLWAHQGAQGIYWSSPALGSDGLVYVASTDGVLTALNPDGAEVWRFRTKGPGTLPSGAIFASPTIGRDGTVYVAGLYDPNLYALKPADGSIKWVCRFPKTSDDPKTGGWPFASPVVRTDGTIYQTLLYDNHIYAIDPGTGGIRESLTWESRPSSQNPISLIGDGWSEPVIGPNGMIYVSCDDPYLRAFDLGGGGWAKQFGDVGGFTLTVDKNNVIYAASDDGHVYVIAANGSLVTQFETGGWPAFPVLAADGVLIVADSRDYSSLNAGAKNAVWAISAAGTTKP